MSGTKMEETEMSETTNKPEKVFPYSYHTFIFPFIFNDSGKVSVKEFREKALGSYWTEDYRKDQPMTTWEYAQFCYFNPAGRNAIFMEKGDSNPVVYNFRFDLGKKAKDTNWLGSTKGKENPFTYEIVKGPFRANLAINGIRLKLFTTGIGMLIFELENYDLPDEKSIILINEFGRRVFKPFVYSDGSCSLCADTISLNYPGGSMTDRISGVMPQHNSDIRLMQPIVDLLTGEKHHVTTNPKHGYNELYIEPIIDDRMFVACFYLNAAFANDMAKWDPEKGQYRYLSDAEEKYPSDKDNLAARLYKMMFVDGNGLSCHSRTMLTDMLKSHIYQRWQEYSSWENNALELEGTVTGISEFSMVCATACPEQYVEGLINPFLTMYVEMAILVLAQRASLLSFERQISDCARGKLRVGKIQQEYVLFQSKLLLREVTPQQQGIELYDLLLQNLFIDKECKELESQINALFALQNDKNNQADNLLLFLLATFSIAELVSFLFEIQSCTEIWTAVAIFGAILGLYVINRLRRLK